jgi:hypothetical protein
VANGSKDTLPERKAHFGQLGGFTTPGLAGNDHHLVRLKRLGDRFKVLANGEGLWKGHLWDGRLPCRHHRFGLIKKLQKVTVSRAACRHFF